MSNPIARRPHFPVALLALCVAGCVSTPDPSLTAVRQKAEAGDPVAALAYGEVLLDGAGVPADKAQGVVWIGKAAAAKVPAAMREMGRLTGDGIITGTPDPGESARWLAKAAAAGDARAMTLLGIQAAKRGDDPGALDWYGRAAAAGDGLGQAHLGEALVFGLLGAKPDLARGHALLAEAMLSRVPYAEAVIGLAYVKGQGVKVDPAAAVQWCDAAARAGEPRGAACMGALLMDGVGVAKDEKRGRALLELAAANDDPDARRLLQERR